MKGAPVQRRRTRQRAAIRAAFEEARRPLSIPEALELAQKEVAGLGIATVYRTVGTLLEEGFLSAVEIPGGSTRYEVAGRGHHHHFYCRRCQRVFEVEGCVPEVERLAPAGFRIEGHEILLGGLCAECARPSARR
ncbi:MAG: transcriptional repressor [Bryobacteraceae bacterium]